MSNPIESFSQPVSDDQPSGENLEYDPQFLQLEALLKPDAGPSIGNKEQEVGAASEPDWKGVEKLAAELLARTRDLRIQTYATIASLHTRGLFAFRDNLELLRIFVSDFWDSVHPQLDPDDDNDPTLRQNSLEMLNSYAWVARRLYRVRLVELQGVGGFGAHDIFLARGAESPVAGEEVPDPNIIRQAFASVEPEALAGLSEAVAASLVCLEGINDAWQFRAETGQGPFAAGDKDNVTVLYALNRVREVLMENTPQGESSPETPAAAPGPAATGVAAPLAGINSRADVIRVLDKVCDYYGAHEPSSPVPLLLRRAQRLVEKSFMEILEDMVPDSLSQAQVISGKRDSE